MTVKKAVGILVVYIQRAKYLHTQAIAQILPLQHLFGSSFTFAHEIKLFSALA